MIATIPAMRKTSVPQIYTLFDKWKTQEEFLILTDKIIVHLKEGKIHKSERKPFSITAFKNRIRKAKIASEKLFSELIKEGLNPLSMYINADTPTEFTTLTLVEKDLFPKEEFRKAYEISRKIKTSCNTESFNIDFRFQPLYDLDDEKSLVSNYFTGGL